MTSQTQAILTELRRRLEELYGERLERLVLFGSQARGDAEEGSDIDVLIVLKGTVDTGKELGHISEITSELSLENNVVISSLVISAERFARGEGSLLSSVHREGVPI
ncbi:MAG: nucleotidyltransferase domain-containing protein [bacterium]